MSDFTFTLRGNCGRTIKSLDCLSYNYRSLLHYDRYIIDMNGVNFVHPTAVVGILCLLERLLKLGKSVEILLPSDPEVCNYFSKIRLLDALRSITEIEAPESVLANILPKVTPILPVASFSNEVEVEQLAVKIEEVMHHQGFTNLLWPCYTITAELAANVVQHSESERGWVLAQNYQYPYGNVIEIAVGDAGVGMRRSLKKNPQLADSITDDTIAVKQAVVERVSRYSDPLRGNGLYQVCTEVQGLDRRFTIRSGYGCLTVFGDGRQIAYRRPPIVGVLAEARIPC